MKTFKYLSIFFGVIAIISSYSAIFMPDNAYLSSAMFSWVLCWVSGLLSMEMI